jgi:hypothetical protein
MSLYVSLYAYIVLVICLFVFVTLHSIDIRLLFGIIITICGCIYKPLSYIFEILQLTASMHVWFNSCYTCMHTLLYLGSIHIYNVVFSVTDQPPNIWPFLASKHKHFSMCTTRTVRLRPNVAELIGFTLECVHLAAANTLKSSQIFRCHTVKLLIALAQVVNIILSRDNRHLIWYSIYILLTFHEYHSYSRKGCLIVQ